MASRALQWRERYFAAETVGRQEDRREIGGEQERQIIRRTADGGANEQREDTFVRIALVVAMFGRRTVAFRCIAAGLRRLRLLVVRVAATSRDRNSRLLTASNFARMSMMPAAAKRCMHHDQGRYEDGQHAIHGRFFGLLS